MFYISPLRVEHFLLFSHIFVFVASQTIKIEYKRHGSPLC